MFGRIYGHTFKTEMVFERVVTKTSRFSFESLSNNYYSYDVFVLKAQLHSFDINNKN